MIEGNSEQKELQCRELGENVKKLKDGKWFQKTAVSSISEGILRYKTVNISALI